MLPNSIPAWKNHFLALPVPSCSLGNLTLAGTIREGRGATGKDFRVLGQWAFVYLVDGRGFYEDVLGNRMEIEPGNWILVFPELGHRYGPLPGQRWNEVFVCFQGALFEEWRKGGIFDASRPVGTLQPVAEGWEEMAGMLRRFEKKKISALEAMTLWQSWMARVLAQQAPAKIDSQLWIERACRFFSENLASPDNGGHRVAAELGMGYENFRKKFTHHLGVSPGRYRETLRIEKAKQLLQSKRLTNKELAEMLGFCDEAHFSKTFRKLAGQSPKSFSRKSSGGGLAVG